MLNICLLFLSVITHSAESTIRKTKIYMINGIIMCVNASGDLFYCPPSFSLQAPLMKTTPVGRRGAFWEVRDFN